MLLQEGLHLSAADPRGVGQLRAGCAVERGPLMYASSPLLHHLCNGCWRRSWVPLLLLLLLLLPCA